MSTPAALPAPPATRRSRFPVPGAPFSRRRRNGFQAYIVTTLAEREGDSLYNSAVILGRNGELVGKYRKVHLTLSEAEAGFLPGCVSGVSAGLRENRHCHLLGQLVQRIRAPSRAQRRGNRSLSSRWRR
ncbi:nitrilase-related carbon-nitrogen hydrolase [Victivallis sp.]|uniref:nitrilase-related carbon-nitrogen hydrolase n=1 Tax=Victivallis sp. TaxID=2049020 RepID=UPI003A929797